MTTTNAVTITIEQAEECIARGMARLCALQSHIDIYDAQRIPCPVDLIDQYQDVADRLVAFADAWGFAIDDVTIERQQMM